MNKFRERELNNTMVDDSYVKLTREIVLVRCERCKEFLTVYDMDDNYCNACIRGER